ncbi:hypothetical protein [Sinorhizobium meliloti]|uniref:hypothetical protein n=1 Tax=Rhizobium meliloti TaxID=382 RepID=UPI001296479A|nr:hypothetical protein [Sinorhizobium meliloti]MQU92856.1 hypothetical protein [Sinorhizobium meliloti]
MDFPDFFNKAPIVTLHDPLAGFLGASASGVMTYCYADAAKLAGHSCPTVAGAYLMIRKGLAWLCGNELPERGGIEAHMRDARDEGTTGVVAAIATLLTGAAPENGFGSIGAGRYSLHFDAPIIGLMALLRRDTGMEVHLDLDVPRVQRDAAMRMLFPKVAAGSADGQEQARFATHWQDRMARMLLDHADDPEFVRVAAWQAAA